ncbi:MAG TPA: TIGR02186 family protein [Allosphingosinicella sp.]|nr:TIGR02186 family protein [Allosphingosinicella sp.]
MSRWRALVLALFAPAILAQSEPRLVPDVSDRNIEIHYSFAGAELLLFGAIVYPGGRPPEGRTDVAVVLKGPLERIVLREKQKVAGIWMNVGRVRFRSAPSYYAVASSRPLAQLIDERTAAIYELGLDNLQLSPGGGARPEVLRRFEHGLLDLKIRSGLYAEYPRGVEISEGVLYRARIAIPARVPVGTYTAETFLIRNGRVIAGAAREIRIEKLGFEGFVAEAAERWSLAYGIAAVAVSLLLGWGASAAFRRRYG